MVHGKMMPHDEAVLLGKRLALDARKFLSRLDRMGLISAVDSLCFGFKTQLREMVKAEEFVSCPHCQGGGTAQKPCPLCGGFREVPDHVSDAYKLGLKINEQT